MKKIVIIGNGISGVTAARNIRKRSNDEIHIISYETNYFFSRTALMYIYMGHMTYQNTKPYEDSFWKKSRINLIKDWVTSINYTEKKILLKHASPISYDKLILATGSQSNKFGWPGQNLQGVQSLYSLQDLELMKKNTKNIQKAVIVGGGLIGIEMAEMLHSRNISVTYLIREKHFWGNVLPKEEAQLIDQHIVQHHVNLRKEEELEEILGNDSGKVCAIKTKKKEIIDTQFVGITVGVHPNIGLAKGDELETDRGILVNSYLQTNIPDVYAIGDCTQLKKPPKHRRPIEAVWYAGRMMGETVALTLTGKKTAYQPGIWFNSAKFFDIEYQTYGTVLADTPEGHDKFYWEAPDKTKCIKIIFKTNSYQVVGINLFGIRNRHEVWNQWLTEKRTLHYVINHLKEANFDPEFFTRWEIQIQKKFEEEHMISQT